MQIHEIAKLVGLELSQVMADLDVEAGRGAHMKQIDDARAKEYVEAKGFEFPEADVAPPKEAVKRKIRFWCANRWNNLPSRPSDARRHIKFDEWTREYDESEPECAFLRTTDIRDRLQIYEVLPEPYADDRMRVDFIRFLEKLMFSGQTHADGISREGQKSALAVLFDDMAEALPRHIKNSPRKLAVVIAEKVSLSLNSFGTEE